MKVGFCFLSDYENLQMACCDSFGSSKSKAKKYLGKTFNKIQKEKAVELPLNLVNDLLINPEYQGPSIRILYEDDLWLAISKPCQIHSHPLTYNEKDNVLSFLRANGFLKPIGINTTQFDRGLLYRLDYETSGLLILCNDERALVKIRSNFNQIVKQKIYLAIVKGKISSELKLNHHIKAFGPKGSKMIEADDGQSARIDVSLIEYDKSKNHSLVKVFLHQGIRHQIRVQMSLIGHPILGDSLYGGEHSNRLYLHCNEYQFSFNGIKKNFQDDKEEELLNFLRSNT